MIILVVPGIVAFINKDFFFSSLALSKPLKLILYQKFKALAYLPG
jgi:hypothetical protein